MLLNEGWTFFFTGRILILECLAFISRNPSSSIPVLNSVVTILNAVAAVLNSVATVLNPVATVLNDGAQLGADGTVRTLTKKVGSGPWKCKYGFTFFV